MNVTADAISGLFMSIVANIQSQREGEKASDFLQIHREKFVCCK